LQAAFSPVQTGITSSIINAGQHSGVVTMHNDDYV